jgi:intracellular septation protein
MASLRATAIAIGATVVQIAWMRFKNGKVETMQWVSLGVIVVFGGATLVTQDETFIKWKPSVLYWLMCATLWVGYFFFKRNFIQALDGRAIRTSARGLGQVTPCLERHFLC